MVTPADTVTLYTTAGCHLCEQARAVLHALDPTLAIRAVDVAEDGALMARYGERIPVVCHQGRELGWPFGLPEARAFLQMP